MKNLLYLIIISSLLAISLQANAQKPLKEKDLKYEANVSYEVGEIDRAIKEYIKLLKLFPQNALEIFRLGDCYLKKNHYKKALDYLQKAYKMDPKVDPDVQYLIARVYHFTYKFKEASTYYRYYWATLTSKESDKKKNIDRKIYECKNGIEFMKNPVVGFKIENIGPAINTKYDEYGPVVSADETVLIFTSRRKGTTGDSKALDDKYYEDIYISKKKDTIWGKARNMGKIINADDHDACIGLSPDGQKLFIYRNNYKSYISGDIYVSNLDGNKWSIPEKLGENVNTKRWEGSASITPDEKILYFTSTRKEGSVDEKNYDKDIYVVKKMPTGEWAIAQNLGPLINTKYDEDGPFIHPDGKTLYFSSKGHKGMGGYDIFTSVWNEKKRQWSKPKNLGYPINTPGDDVYFVWSADGKRAYFSTVREDGYGNQDIYKLYRPEKKTALIVMKGRTLSVVDSLPVPCIINVADNETQEMIGIYNSNSFSGKFTIILPPGRNYNIAVESDGYLFHSENIDIPDQKDYFEINKDIYLEPIEIGRKTILRNIFFDIGLDSLRIESETELERLYKILIDNPTLVLEISGHTDNIGSEEDNHRLSENRAKSVVNFLIAKNIEHSRLRAAGYGESKPVESNETEEGRQLNRRTEIEIVDILK